MAKTTVRRNLITNVINLFVNILIGIYYTPYLVNTIGVMAYGLLPISLIINQYIGIITSTLTNSFTRFYSVYVQKNENENASKTLSTSICVISALIVLLTPFLVSLITDLDSFFHIPPNLLESARVLFVYTILGFVVSLFTSILNVTAYALNRLDVINYLNILRHVSKPLLAIVSFELLAVDVKYVGVTGFISECLVFGFSLIFFLKYKPAEVTFSICKVDKLIFTSIIGMSAWTLIHLCGDTMLYRTDNLIINHFWGLTASGRIGAISVMGDYIKNAVGVIGSLFGPLILIAYSKGRHNDIKDLAISQSFIVGSLSMILTGIIIGFSKPVLNIWLGDDFENYSLWLSIKLIVCPFYAAGGVLAFVYRSWNKVKLPAILTVLLGLVDVLVMFLCGKCFPSESDINYILIVCSFFTLLQCYFLNVYCVDKIYCGLRKPLMRNFVRLLVVFTVVYMFCSINALLIPVNSLYCLIASFMIIGFLSFGVLYFLIFNTTEKVMLLKIVKS